MAIIELSCEGVLSAGDHNEINKGSWFVGFCNAHADIKTNTKQWAIGYISKWKVYFKMFAILQTKSESVVSDSLRFHGLYSLPGSSVQNSLGKNTGVC